MTALTPTQRLAVWYQNNCNDDWEHTYGIRIGTIDNPGWSLRIDLAETPLSGLQFLPVEWDKSAEDWIRCWVEEDAFNGAGGARNLDELIECFLAWVAAAEKAG